MTTQIDVKKNFEEALGKLGFSKRKIADLAGMPPGSLGGVLSHNNPTVQQLWNISRGLGVSITYLLIGGDAEEELRENYIFEPMRTPELKKDWNPKKPNVAARVEMILRKKKITKIEAAKRIKAIPSWWSPILKRNNPTVRVLLKIAHGVRSDAVDIIQPVTPAEFGSIMMPKIHY